MTFTALVLAGSRGGAEPVADYAGVADKALIEIAGSTMLERVILALRSAGARRVVVSASSADVAAAARRAGAETLSAAGGPSESVERAFAELGAPLLVTTADHALLDPAWVTRFLSDVPENADVAALLAERRTVEAAVPETKRTWLRFSDGQWSGCNLFWLATPRAAGAIALWRTIEANRKRPWRIVRALGPLPLLRYLAGRLSLGDAVAALGQRAGVRAVAIGSPFGLAAVDVDKPDDLDLVRSIVEAA